MHKRSEKRKEMKLKVLFGENNCENVGFTSNISRRGMYIESESARAFDREIQLLLNANEQVFKLRGEVRWRMESPSPGQGGKIIEGMGVKIVDASQEYLNLVEP
ncbi:MAG: PilZ domain-containing protein [Candidatus Aminicenantes bacterium]|nr:PilZ domain-containing protein [Candidatus Aminicenantes bacterium]